jgi:5-methylcytosine-specific restriction endonuclease McrA
MTTDKKIQANQQNGVAGGQVIRLRAIEKYYQSPKVCPHCAATLTYEQRKNKFCSQSCAASYNNLGRERAVRYGCAHCDTLIFTRKFCGRVCAADHRRKYTPEEAAVVRKSRVREVSANYRARVRNQTPDDVDRAAIREFYASCPEGHEVDHIIPISRGGLHTLSNLQYLTVRENRSKGNKLVRGERIELPLRA